MRNRINERLAAGLAMALLLTSGQAWAEGRPPQPLSLELDSGAAFIHEPGFGHGWRYGGSFFIKTAKHASFEVLVERFSVPVEEGTAGLTAGRMGMTSLVFNQHVYFLSRGTIVPFATMGVACVFIGFSPDDTAVLPQKNIVDRLALQLGGGLDLRVSSRLALSGKVRYNMVKTWVEELPRTGPIRATDPRTQDILYLYGLELALGLKFSF